MAGQHLHPILTWRSCAFLTVFTGFLYYLSTALPAHGPDRPKYDAPRLTYERAPKDIPEFASLFSPETHPALRKQF